MRYIKGFDTLRGVSIIFVLLTHLGLLEMLPENEFLRERVWLLMSGRTGVQIFFTLSGFLITRILLHELNEFGNINFALFYKRRFLRLLPPLIVFYIAVAILMRFHLIQTTSYGFLFSFFYLYNFVPLKYYTGEMGHTWSLAVEEQYYLIWPLVISFVNKKMASLLIFLVLMACIAAVYLYPEWSITKLFRADLWFIPAVAPIMAGSFFAWLIHNQEDFYRRYFTRKNATIWAGVVIFLYPLYSPLLELTFVFQSVGVSIILIWVLFNQESKFTSILNNRLLSYIGTISYGIYVYQGLFLRTGPGGEIWIQQFPQNIILTFATAILSYHLLEKPVLKLKKRYKRTAAKAA
jgi:peptidoglycan/LPS O-acetylase OafA/YrhL